MMWDRAKGKIDKNIFFSFHGEIFSLTMTDMPHIHQKTKNFSFFFNFTPLFLFPLNVSSRGSKLEYTSGYFLQLVLQAVKLLGKFHSVCLHEQLRDIRLVLLIVDYRVTCNKQINSTYPSIWMKTNLKRIYIHKYQACTEKQGMCM